MLHIALTQISIEIQPTVAKSLMSKSVIVGTKEVTVASRLFRLPGNCEFFAGKVSVFSDFIIEAFLLSPSGPKNLSECAVSYDSQL